MKQNLLKTFVLALLMCVSMGAWSADVLGTQVSFASWEESISSYSSTEWSDNGCTFAYASNNNKGWAYARLGGKNLSNQDSYIKYNTKIEDEVSKIVLHHGGKSNDKLTINSISVYVYSNAAFTTQVASRTFTEGVACASAGDIELAPVSGTWPANSYYKIVVNWTNSAKSNYGLNVSGFDFYLHSNKSEAGIEYSVDSYLATKGGSNSFPVLTNPNSLTATYSSSKEEVATVNATTGAITLVGAGETIITATTAENANYAAGFASYTLRVLEPVNLSSEIVVNGWSELVYGNEKVYVTDDISFIANQALTAAVGDTEVRYLQLKANEGYIASPTINAPAGYTVTVKFSSGSNASSETKIQINEETPVSVTGKGDLVVSTTAAVSSFKISNVNAGAAQIASITITPAPASSPVYTEKSLPVIAVGEYEGYPGNFATFSNEKDVFIPFMDDSEAYTTYVYTVFTDGEELLLEDAESALTYEDAETGLPGYYVPANTGVLLMVMFEDGAETNVPYYEMENVEVNDLTEDNMLRPASAPMTGDYKFYKLAYDDYTNKTGLGFYWGAANGADFEAKAGGAYLAVPKSAGSIKGFRFDGGDVTGIQAAAIEKSDVIYNLQGQRVVAPKAGVYVKNGKKIIR